MTAKQETAPGDLIRQHAGSETNRRFLSGMGTFRAETDMPEWLRVLLVEIDRAERASRPAQG